MSDARMKLGLQLVGGDAWVAGIYYIHNLVRALRSLPAAEQPDIVLLVSAGTRSEHYRDIESYVTVLPVESRGSDSGEQSVSRLREVVGSSRVARTLYRRVREPRERQRRQSFEQSLRIAGVTLVFPCMDSLGADFGIPWLGWAWDFQHKHLPGFFSKSARLARDGVFLQLARDARLIVTSSEDALSDFDCFYPGSHDKLRVLRFRTVPLDSWYGGDAVAAISKYHLPPRYLLVPNQFWVHKNHRTAYEAMAMLKDVCPDLVLVCTGNTYDSRRPRHFDELSAYAREHGLEDRIRVLGLLPRADQIQLVRGAAAILQPSLFEGWSTVVEDARALGKRLFLSDIAVHKEQNPPGAVYFDPHDARGLAAVLTENWSELRPGPHLAEEQEAKERQVELVADYARTFVRIGQELLEIDARAGS